MLTPSLRRGLAAGLVAGVLAGLFALVVGHDPMAEAVELHEDAHHGHADDPAADHDHHDGHDDGHAHGDGEDHGHDDDGHAHDGGDDHEHLFSRTTQQLMLPVGTAVVGTALGGMFGLLFAVARPRMREPDDWRASLKLGAAAWAVTALTPTLTFPANPEGVGDAADVGARTSGYVTAIGVALALALAAWALADRVRATTDLSTPARQSVVGAAVLVTALAALALLPTGLPGDGFPAEVLWRFRLASLATQSVLWVGIAAGFGLLWTRAGSSHAPTPHEPQRV